VLSLSVVSVPRLQPNWLAGSRPLLPLTHRPQVSDVVSFLHGHWPVVTLHRSLTDPATSQEHCWQLPTQTTREEEDD